MTVVKTMESPLAVYDTILKLWECEAQQFSRNNQLDENFSSNFMQEQMAATGSGNTCREEAVDVTDPVGRAAKVPISPHVIKALLCMPLFLNCLDYIMTFRLPFSSNVFAKDFLPRPTARSRSELSHL